MEENKKSPLFWWYNEESEAMLTRGYLEEGVDGPQRVRDVAKTAAEILNKPELEEQLFEAIGRGWMSLSSPIWSNFGLKRGLPISCFSSYVDDNLYQIFDSKTDVAMQTKAGGGTAGKFCGLRAKGEEVVGGAVSSGAMSFIGMFDQTVTNVMQNGVRRGGFAAYLSVEHPEYLELLKVKSVNHSMQTINTAAVIPEGWMQSMLEGDTEKRKIWVKTMETRKNFGIPYLFFEDNANKNKPQVYKDKGLEITHSNLCSEIMLPTNPEETLVCCLMSMNLALYDEWKDTNAVELATYLLDAVLTEFINKTHGMQGLQRARKFAEKHRAIGIGALGFHTYLQENMIPFDSMQARGLNRNMFKNIFEAATNASKKMAEEYGEPEVMKGYGMRHATVCAVAPTTSSSSILGQVSPGVEPYMAGTFTVGLAKGGFSRYNPALKRLLAERGKDDAVTWKQIRDNKGSVETLDFLTEDEKEVFKTFREISPLAIIQQASIRQEFIDQGQSINLLIDEAVSPRQLSQLHIEAWKLGLKSLYYQRGVSAGKDAMTDIMSCVTCEG